MDIDVHIAAAVFSDGSEIAFPAQGVILLVGANNSGKSRTLTNLAEALAHGTSGLVVRGITRGGGADQDQLLEWARERGFAEPTPHGDAFMIHTQWSGERIGISPTYGPGVAAGGPLGDWSRILVQTMDAGQRLGLTAVQQSFDPTQGKPLTSLQVLQVRPELEDELSEASVRAFGAEITLNRVAGPSLRLYVGRPERSYDRWDADYAEEFRRLPAVDEQGDGYKAFLGIMLGTIVAQAPILMIDEPEAFLHPPQARKLGHELAAKSQRGTQVIAATHSADVLDGAHSSGVDVSVLRLTRDGDFNRPTMLESERLAELWGDPLLRYSGALDALFSRGLVICENERDCTFYLAALDEDPNSPSDHDLKFISVGGKGSVPRVADAIRALGVPVSAICDIDVLNDETLLRRIVESLGGDLDASMQKDLRVLNSAVGALAVEQGIEELRVAVEGVIDSNSGSTVTTTTRKALKGLAQRTTGWKRLKQDGIAPLRGEQSTAARELIAALRVRGLHVVDRGELEAWVPEAGGKGANWLSRAFELEGHRGSEVRAFVRHLVPQSDDGAVAAQAARSGHDQATNSESGALPLKIA